MTSVATVKAARGFWEATSLSILREILYCQQTSGENTLQGISHLRERGK